MRLSSLPKSLNGGKGSVVLSALVALFALISAAEAAPLAGRAAVIDGDTIEIAGQRIRIWGVDAPESGQTCQDRAGRPYRCGQQAALALADWLDAAQPVRCEPKYRDPYGRIVAACQRAGADVGAWLVGQGYALDWTRYSNGRYAGEQRKARAIRQGIWQGRFTLPWEWRRR